jgi:hypothetical protein
MGANQQTTVPSFTIGQVLTAEQQNQSARTGVPVFATTVERDAAFGGAGEKTLAEGQLAYLEDSDVVQYYDGSGWATVGPTTAGKVLQVVQATFATAASSSSTSYTDTGLTANITPATATNKVLVSYSLQCNKQAGNAASGINLKLLRDATAIDTQENIFRTDTSLTFQSLQSFVYLDNPTTTSAITYKLQFANRSAVASVGVFTANTTGTITLIEIEA